MAEGPLLLRFYKQGTPLSRILEAIGIITCDVTGGAGGKTNITAIQLHVKSPLVQGTNEYPCNKKCSKEHLHIHIKIYILFKKSQRVPSKFCQLKRYYIIFEGTTLLWVMFGRSCGQPTNERTRACMVQLNAIQ